MLYSLKGGRARETRQCGEYSQGIRNVEELEGFSMLHSIENTTESSPHRPPPKSQPLRQGTLISPDPSFKAANALCLPTAASRRTNISNGFPPRQLKPYSYLPSALPPAHYTTFHHKHFLLVSSSCPTSHTRAVTRCPPNLARHPSQHARSSSCSASRSYVNCVPHHTPSLPI